MKKAVVASLLAVASVASCARIAVAQTRPQRRQLTDSRRVVAFSCLQPNTMHTQRRLGRALLRPRLRHWSLS